MRIIISIMLLVVCTATRASEPTELLQAHLVEMKKHLAFVEQLDEVDYQCTDLVERVKRMTHHMEMMTDMMIRMHASESDHEMFHEKEGEASKGQ